MIQLVFMSLQANNCISQTFPVGQLPEAHAKELMPTAEITNAGIAAMFVNIAGKLLVVDQAHQLSKDVLALIH